MGHWFINQGWNRNLLVQLSGGPASYQIDVYVVARFQFYFAPGAVNWTPRETAAWKRRFANLVYDTWSEKWLLISDISCNPIDVARGTTTLPTARVRVHAMDQEDPLGTFARQHIYVINVFRRAPGEGRQRQDADALQTSEATMGDPAHEGASAARLYEDSLELGPPSSVDGNQQVVAMHEFGHMLGLMHSNDMEHGCTMDRNSPVCYGQEYSPESASIMGRGQEVRREDYRIFLRIISGLVTEVPASGWMGSLGSSPRRLMWTVEGSVSAFCSGEYQLSSSLGIRPHFIHGHGRRSGPYGVA